MSNVKKLEEAGVVSADSLTPQERERLESLSEDEVRALIEKSRGTAHDHVKGNKHNNGEQKRTYEE